MANNKKTICLVTNWYPTEENPYYGSFFKEQAFALSDYYDFLVLHISEKRGVWSSHSPSVMVTNRENNTVEYSVVIKNSIVYDVLNLLANLRYQVNKRRVNSNSINYKGKAYIARSGIGKKLSDAYIRRKYCVLTRMLRYGAEKIDLNFDVLYCVDAQYEAGNLKILSDITGKPYIISEHSPVPPLGLLINDLNYCAIENANLFLAISHDKIRQMMMQDLKLPPTRYIGNMVDEDRFVMPDRMRDRASEEHGVKTILIMGANSFYKNYGMFYDVMEKLCKVTSANYRVRIAGYAANKGYAKSVAEFEDTFKASAFSDKLEMIPEIPRESVNDIYAGSNVFVMTSIQEGQPLAALEAACCGLPIYSTRCGGVEDYVDENIGRVYNITDVEGMAEGLKEFVEGKITFDSNYIRNKVISQFGKAAFVRNFVEAFDSVAKYDR